MYLLDSSYMHITVYIVLWQWETYMMYIHQHWTLFDHSLYWKGHIISAWTKPWLSLTSSCCHAPRFSPISLVFFAFFCISWFLGSLKRGAVFPPLPVGLQCTFLSCIFVQCCAFERWVLCTVSPLLQFSLVPTFCLKKKMKGQCSIIGCRISSISCLASLEHGKTCLIVTKGFTWPISCAN